MGEWYHFSMGLFAVIFIWSLSYAADCFTSLGHITVGAPNNCTNLYVDAPLTLGWNANPVIINVTGDAVISADIDIDGTAGINLPITIDGAGALGGPGAGHGGGRFLSVNEDGQDLSATAPFPASGANGKKVSHAGITCGNGGGGGGFHTAGLAGDVCSTGNPTQAAGGTAFGAGEFAFTLALFRGGFGGGAGDFVKPGDGELGTGGGGGGGLYINLTGGGTITIQTGVTISARGGTGGVALNDGGGGGGGSGGAIWLKTTGNVQNDGILDVRGGDPGSSTSSGAGGRGGDGAFKIESSNLNVEGTGRLLPSSGPSSGEKLHSSINCGTVAKKNDHQALMAFGAFLLAFLVTIRIPSRRQKKI